MAAAGSAATGPRPPAADGSGGSREEAEQTRDPERRRFLQSVVVVGAGPAGCELAGSLIELMHRAIRRDCKQLVHALCRVLLVDGVERVLPTMHTKLSSAAVRGRP